MRAFQKKISINFVIPDIESFQSGGNIYNKNLMDGLLKIGYSIRVMDWETFSKKKVLLKSYYFFDTLYLAQLKKYLPKNNEDATFYLIVHHLESLYPPENWTSRDFFLEKEYAILKLFDGFLTSSQFTADYLVKNQLTTKKIVIPPAINFQVKQKKQTVIANIQAIMVANLVERKGILPFLQTLANNPHLQQTQNLQIHLIGTSKIAPDYAQACLQTIANHPTLKKIICYHGQLSPPQVHSLYQKANLFISTAFMETYGMALQEARAFQLPILALKGGNIENHIDNKQTGWLVENMVDLVHQLVNLVNQPTDLCSVQQRIIRRTAINFYTWEAAARQFVRQLA